MLRTNLWLVPGIEVLAAIALFAVTLSLDRAAYHGDFRLPSWVISGTADAARQILTAIAAAVITVVGVVFSIILVTLTLASTQFGPRMLRNFIRDRGTQLTLGTFVATFVYAVLVLVSIGPGPRGDFVPHIGVTVTLGLMVTALGVLIYFIHHTATSIQLPQVIASIARDLSEAIEVQGGYDAQTGLAGDRESGPSAAELIRRMEADGGVVRAPASGYLQFIRHRILVQFAAEADAVIALNYRPGHFLVQGHPFAVVWPPQAAARVSDALGRAHITGPNRTLTQDVSFGVDQLVEIAIRALSPAVNDTFTAMTCIDWLADSLCKITVRWNPARVHRDGDGFIRVITAEPSHERLVQRAFEKIRQASYGMPAVMIRQLDAIVKIMTDTSSAGQRRVLLDQAAMIQRASERSVPEKADRDDIQRRYEEVLTAGDRSAERNRPADGTSSPVSLSLGMVLGPLGLRVRVLPRPIPGLTSLAMSATGRMVVPVRTVPGMGLPSVRAPADRRARRDRVHHRSPSGRGARRQARCPDIRRRGRRYERQPAARAVREPLSHRARRNSHRCGHRPDDRGRPALRGWRRARPRRAATSASAKAVLRHDFAPAGYPVCESDTSGALTKGFIGISGAAGPPYGRAGGNSQLPTEEVHRDPAHAPRLMAANPAGLRRMAPRADAARCAGSRRPTGIPAPG